MTPMTSMAASPMVPARAWMTIAPCTSRPASTGGTGGGNARPAARTPASPAAPRSSGPLAARTAPRTPGSSTRHQANPRTRRGRHPEPDRPGRATRGQRRPGRLQPRQARLNPLPRPPPGTATHRSGHTGLLPHRSGTQPAHPEHRAPIASPTRDARPLSHKQPKRYITVTGATAATGPAVAPRLADRWSGRQVA